MGLIRSPWFRRSVLAMVSVALVGIVIGIVFLRLQQRGIYSELARLEGKGIPTTAGDLEALVEKRNQGPDLTAQWMKALAPLGTYAYEKEAESLPILGALNPPEAIRDDWTKRLASEEFILQHETVLEEITELIQWPGSFRFGSRRIGLDGSHAELELLRESAKLFMLDARVKAVKGDTHGAAMSLLTMFKHARVFATAEEDLANAFRRGVFWRGIDELRAQLSGGAIDDADLLALQQELETPRDSGWLAAQVRTGRVHGLECYRAAGFDVSGGNFPSFYFHARLGADVRRFLHFMQQHEAAAELPLRNAIIAFERIDDEKDGMQDRAFAVREYYGMSSLLIPFMSIGMKSEAAADALVTCAATALACDRFRRCRGAFPRSLQDLIPEFQSELASDPFTGTPLRFVREEHEITVSSEGRSREREVVEFRLRIPVPRSDSQ